jgi:hypothetical protein
LAFGNFLSGTRRFNSETAETTAYNVGVLEYKCYFRAAAAQAACIWPSAKGAGNSPQTAIDKPTAYRMALAKKGTNARAAGDYLDPVLVAWISGPSTTAEIKMTRIKGVHGPRNLNVFIVGDNC